MIKLIFLANSLHISHVIQYAWNENNSQAGSSSMSTISDQYVLSNRSSLKQLLMDVD